MRLEWNVPYTVEFMDKPDLVLADETDFFVMTRYRRYTVFVKVFQGYIAYVPYNTHQITTGEGNCNLRFGSLPNRKWNPVKGSVLWQARGGGGKF